jgi:hypothetical protein
VQAGYVCHDMAHGGCESFRGAFEGGETPGTGVFVLIQLMDGRAPAVAYIGMQCGIYG